LENSFVAVGYPATHIVTQNRSSWSSRHLGFSRPGCRTPKGRSWCWVHYALLRDGVQPGSDM